MSKPSCHLFFPSPRTAGGIAHRNLIPHHRSFSKGSWAFLTHLEHGMGFLLIGVGQIDLTELLPMLNPAFRLGWDSGQLQ